jgi:hypothetical protein
MDSNDQFVTLQAGQYWQARIAIKDEEILKGDVLLIQSVRDVDNAAHTIIMRPHPRWYAANPRCDSEIRFLVQDFLEKFDPCPDYKRIRNAELAEVQGRVSSLQHELAEISSSSDAMKEVVADGLRKWEKEQKLLPGTADTLPPPTPDATLDSSLTTEKIETMKLSMAKAGQIAKIQAEHIKAKVEQIGETVKAMTPFYQEQAAAALATTEDVRAHVGKLMTGIASLDLYVGTDVYVEQVSKGKDASDGPDGEHLPLTIMQRKLYMDEELSAWADVDEKFDTESTEQFFKTLRKYKSLVDQIFPTERCIVCMAVTHRERDYGNAWENAMKNEKNKTVFLLIRNGENIHVVYSPVESHMKSPKLFPSESDIDKIFRDTKWWGEDEGRRITYNDVKYTDKLSEHEAVAVHYKRFLILLAGLDHRENLFGTFYDEPKGMRFISMLFQQKYMRFIYDADGSGKMLPSEDRPKFMDWATTKNAYLQSGSRVMCMWADVMTSTTAPGVCKYNSRSSNYNDRWLADPTKRYAVQIAFREGKDILVKCDVKQEVWGRNVDGEWRDSHTREFQAKVNLSKYGGYQVGYICLDAVKADELEWYVHDRENRRNFLNYIRLFKSAIKYLREEEKQEAATRAKLAKALDDGKIVTPDEAAKAISTAVIAWRAAHRGEPLASAEDRIEFPKLLNQIWTVSRNIVLHTIPAEMTNAEWQQAEKWAADRGLVPLRFVQSGKAQTVALYCAPKSEEEDNRLWPMAWVHRIVLTRKKNSFTEQSRQWKVLPAVNAAEVLLHEWEGAAAWFDRPTPIDKFSEKQTIFAHVANYKHNLTLFRSMLPEIWDVMYSSWCFIRHNMQNDSGRVQNPSCLVPFGLILEDKKLKYLAIGTNDAAYLLYVNAPDAERKKKIVKEYSDNYRMKQSAADRLTGKEGDYSKGVHVFEVNVANEPEPNGLCEYSANYAEQNVKLDKLDKCVKKLIQKSKKDQDGAQFWIPEFAEATNA